MRLLYGHSEGIAAWVANRIPHLTGPGFGQCQAIGILSSDEELLAGVVFHDWIPAHRTIQLSLAADSPRWARRGVVGEFLAYPFDELDVRKVWTATPHKNERALRINRGFGFKQEAILARHYGDQHAVICRLFQHEYRNRFIKDVSNGLIQQGPSSTAASA